MIFDRHVAWDILEGKITQFCRPATREEATGWKSRLGQRHQVQVERRQDGEPVKQTLGHIVITGIEHRALRDITEEDANAAGYRYLEHFYRRWREKHGTGPLDPEAYCFIVDFELSREHVPRLLHQDSSHGYTHDPRLALPEEPEAVDDFSQQRITEEAGRVYSATHAEDHLKKEARSIGASLKEAVNRARRSGIDIDENVGRLRMELDEIRRKLSDAA